MKQGTQLDFSGQTIFVGIDVHKKSWKVSLRSTHMELKTFSQEPSPKALSGHLQQNYPSADYRLVYEAGFCGFGYQRQFSELGMSCIVVNPADVPLTDKEKQRKSDTVDCRKLSKTLSEGALKGIFVPGIEQQDDRGIIRVYQQMIKDQTRYKNRIKGWLNFQDQSVAVDTDKYWSNHYICLLKALCLPPSARINLDILLQGYQQTRIMVLTATREVRALSRQPRYQQIIKLIRTIPGIGEITALLLVTEIGDIERFDSLDALCGYVGLVPDMHSSGDQKIILGLTKRAHHQLREKLIEASWIAVRLDPAMTLAFNNLCKRMKKNKAIIRIAKKMLNRIRFVMKNQKPYVTSVVK
ncbi:transposase IS116/IS110/IS902 family protein [Mucilaginibacter paludis DSM 18603]|uniref:Transposase IS116/IS110/IS902 family protein n=1 Tax=Mucilaginibacter paludis DSM 18603 TaxID=714943 RepID=H1YFP5_9SPHI|nr:transposase IS116/IS110/IS902 family protein [Mucilaginibacter paludis DSM 18603]